MRILVISQMYPPNSTGGYGALCRDVVIRWRAAGHDVSVLTTSFRVRGGPPQEDPGVPVLRELEFYWRDHEILRPGPIARVRIERANHRALAAALDRFAPEVVSVWHMGAMSLGLLQAVADRGLPIVAVVGDDWLVYGPRVDAWTAAFREAPVRAALARRLTGLPTTVAPPPERFTACFASRWLLERAVAEPPWPLGRMGVVAHGVDTDAFGPPRPPRPWHGRLLYAGRVEERKGVHVAVEALATLDDAALEVAGPADDAYADRLRGRAAALGAADRLHLTGPLSRADLAARYAAADVLLFPVVWEEPFGLVPLEAMAAGLPVVATGTGGSAEFLEHEGNCLLVERGDAAGLAAAVRRLEGDASLRARLAAGGASTAARYDVARTAGALEAWHAAAAAGFSRGEPDADASASAPAPGG